MIKIAICEDNSDELATMMDWVTEYSAKSSLLGIRCSGFSSGDQFLEAVEQGAYFDVIFLDVFMPGINGIDTAKELKQLGNTSILFFLTSSKDFALDAFAMKARDYIIKPISREKLVSILDELTCELFDGRKDCIMLRSSGSITKVPYNRIKYIEVIQKKLYFYLMDGEIINTSGSIGSIENMLLSASCFIKPHRSYLVNMDYIYMIQPKEIYMLDETKIPVSRGLRSTVKSAFLNYCVNGK